MKLRYHLGWFVVASLLLAACSSGGGGEEAGGKPKTVTIGVANLSLCCAYFIGMSKAIAEEATPYGNVKILQTDADGDAEKFTSDIEDLLAKGVDGIIISGAWLEAAPSALAAIQDAGVPAVMVDRKLKGGDYTSWIGPDNFLIGKEDGQYIVDRLGGQGTLVVLKGGPADNSIGLGRTNGMLSVVQQSNINVITAPDFGGWSEDGGLKVMEDMLAAHDHIDAVFCENDSMCLGAQKAIQDAGRSDEMFLVGVDGQKEALKEILDGTDYAATGLNDSDQIGRAGFDRLMAILAGAQTEKDTVLPSPLITVKNVVKYYDPNSVF